MNRHPTIRWKRLKASWRDTWLLTRQFGWPLLAFLIIVVGGGILYNILASYAGEPDANIFGSFYQVLALTFLQPIKDFPTTWYLEIFYFGTCPFNL